MLSKNRFLALSLTFKNDTLSRIFFSFKTTNFCCTKARNSDFGEKAPGDPISVPTDPKKKRLSPA